MILGWYKNFTPRSIKNGLYLKELYTYKTNIRYIYSIKMKYKNKKISSWGIL